MEQEKLWAVFQKTGKVEDYLRYRGIVVTPGATDSIGGEESDYGKRSQTTSHDRRSDSAEL